MTKFNWPKMGVSNVLQTGGCHRQILAAGDGSPPPLCALGHSGRLRRAFGLLALVLLVPLARAQWQNVTYTLRGGWNSIYLHGDASHATLEQLFVSNPEVISVWRWNPNPTQTQFSTSTLIPSAGTPEWSTWTRGGSANTLLNLSGPSAYLVECSGTSSNTYTATVPQRVQPPRTSWVRNGANLLGFPAAMSPSAPTISAYFASFPVAIATNTKIYKYAGGPLGGSNPTQIFSTTSETLDRTQAYWFDAAVVGNFYGPLEVSPSNLDGLIYGRNGSLISVRVRNRTSSSVNLTVTPVNSAAAPSGQDQITGPVPLTYRSFNSATAAYEFAAITAGSPVSLVLNAQSTSELFFGVNRAQITGAADTLYASLLRFTLNRLPDGSPLMDVFLPASARVTSLSGLWIGDATVTDVQAKVPGFTGTATGRSFPLRIILHVDDTGTARLLSQVFMGRLAAAPNNVGLCTQESALKTSDLATALRYSAAHLPPGTTYSTGTGSVSFGQTLVRTIPIAYNASTNPFVHTYHPDHDNRNARFDAGLSAGIESPAISRECNFTFTANPPAGTSSQGWGSSVIGGSYTETITGIHKTPTTVSGTFVLQRASEIGSITTN